MVADFLRSDKGRTMQNTVPPPMLPRGIRPIVPVLGRRGEFEPTACKNGPECKGCIGHLTVMLPAEQVRSRITEVLSRDCVVVELGLVMMTKEHSYRRGQKIAVQRTWTPEALERWEPIDERAVREAEAIERVRAQVAKPGPAPAIDFWQLLGIEDEPRPLLAEVIAEIGKEPSYSKAPRAAAPGHAIPKWVCLWQDEKNDGVAIEDHGDHLDIVRFEIGEEKERRTILPPIPPAEIALIAKEGLGDAN